MTDALSSVESHTMTLAAILLPQAPVVMSDVLLSHLGQPKVELTPTGMIVRKTAGGGRYQPVDFMQKTLLLDDDRAVFTGAGTVSTLKSLAVDLRDRIRKGMTREGLEGWLASRQGVCGNSTSAMVAWLDHDGYCVGKVGSHVRALALEGGQQVFCCGSGADWLKRNLIKQTRSLEAVGDFSFSERVRFIAIAQTAQHLAQERFLGMRDAFGAGFQVTYYDGARFVPIPQTIYLVFVVEHDDAGPARMTLAGPMVVQRSDGIQLAFELWAPENDDFSIEGEDVVLDSAVRFVEKLVPPLLHTRREPYRRPSLATGDYVAAQTVHVREGKLIGLGSFQLAGDPALTGVTTAGEPNGRLHLSIPRNLFETWMTRFSPVQTVAPLT